MTNHLEKLICQAGEGNKVAFGQLVKRYQQHIFNICYGIIGNVEEAEDATQDIFIKAYSSLSKLQDSRAFYGWLIRIATNTSLNYKKRLGKESKLSFGELENQASALWTNPQDYLESQEKWNEINAALAVMSADHRAILVLREVQGLSYEEIADLLNLPIGTVKSRLNHARDKLRKAVKEKE